MPRLFWLLAAAWLLGCAPAALAQEEPGQPAKARHVRLGVVVAPPFLEKTDTGHFHGLALALWRDVAKDVGLASEIREYTLDGLLAAVRAGEVDVGVSALSITPEREGVMDFSQPFYYTGLGIAVPAKHSLDAVGAVLERLFSPKALAYIGSLLVLLLLVGMVVWAMERRRNPEHFRPGSKGIGDGLWWSAVTMTSVGYGDATPKTMAGRAVALVWMFASVALLASFTAGITSILTVESIGGAVHGPQDLHKVRVGAVRDSSAAEELAASHVGARPYDDVGKGLAALAAGEIDAFVHDRPILLYYQLHALPGVIRVLPGFFDPQLYGFAFPPGSDLRKAVNVALLRRMEDHDYRMRVFGPYLDRAGAH